MYIYDTSYTYVLKAYIIIFIERIIAMATVSRKEARTLVYELLFETEFRNEEDPQYIFDTATEIRELPEDEYIKTVYFGVIEKKSEIDPLIEKYSKGWKINRISRSALCAMRISVFEMNYLGGVPFNVSINEAIETTKVYDEAKTKGFVNGVLNGIKDEINQENVN